VAALCEGNSIRATVRMTGAAKDTVLKLLVDLGAACRDYQREAMVDLPCARLQCDEIWSFCYAKDKNVPEAMRPKRSITKPNCDKKSMVGSVWTWTAIDADTKARSKLPRRHPRRLVRLALHAGSGEPAPQSRTAHHGRPPRLPEPVGLSFGTEIDYAMLVKLYGTEPAGEARYSPPKCIGTRMEVKQGDPDPEHVSTSYAERQNLNMRMGCGASRGSPTGSQRSARTTST